MDSSSQSERVIPFADASTILTSAGWTDCRARLSRDLRSAAARSRVGITTVTGTSSTGIRNCHFSLFEGILSGLLTRAERTILGSESTPQ